MDRFTIFGNPVAHSKSPLMHNYAFRGLKIDACYGRWLLEEGSQLKEAFLSLGLKGANITLPHKESAFAACDVLDPFAQKVGAVNTIVEREGKLHGYNTDASGFLKAVEALHARTVLFIGAGGTAQSTAVILRDAGYAVTILNRSIPRLERFSQQGFETATWDTFVPRNYDLVVNMTSAGLRDDSLPAPRELIEALFRQTQAAVDVIYKKETPFLSLARVQGLPTKDGTNMLLYQGAIACERFTDGQYCFDEILPHMQRAFDIR
jgi:shikimate dehydrogenase